MRILIENLLPIQLITDYYRNHCKQLVKDQKYRTDKTGID